MARGSAKRCRPNLSEVPVAQPARSSHQPSDQKIKQAENERFPSASLPG
jgi:hypothetical protein